MIKIPCNQCKEVHEIHNVTEQNLVNIRKGELMQRELFFLDADSRELMISGICGKCYEKLFPDTDE